MAVIGDLHPVLAICAVTLLAACAPIIESPNGIVTDPFVVAVVAEPAEAAPGDAVVYTAHVMSSAGIADAALTGQVAAQWAYCTEAKPPLEDNAVPRSCLQIDADGAPSGSARDLIGSGGAVTAMVPVDACRLFGPDLPPGDLRPRDPDRSGGFYQPLIIMPAMASFSHRIRCGLPTASPEIDREFREHYHPNNNPIVRELVVRDIAGEGFEVRARIEGASAENFLVFDPIHRSLREDVETVETQWWTTAGSLSHTYVTASAVAVDGVSSLLDATVMVSAPATAYPMTIGVVVRDSRGGSQFSSLTLQTAP